jgi:oxygen-independent coproporphyrinogen-3 oxidase
MNHIKEYTIECNPEFLNEKNLSLFINNGINRISMGIQSFDDRFLSILERKANSKTIFKAIDVIKKSNIKQFNCDLIFGIPYQKMKDLESDLNKVINIKPSHISYYGLTVEKNTPLFKSIKNNKLPLPDEDLSADMYLKVIDILSKNNYHQYEISNFCYDNHYSLHNLNYWNRGEYFGFGPSASSYINGIRYKNVDDLKSYITMINKQTRPATEIIDILEKEQKMEEFVMLSLRKAEGLDFILFYKEFDINLYEHLKEKLPDLVNNERLMIFNKNIIRIKPEGFLIYDYIIEEISFIIWGLYI